MVNQKEIEELEYTYLKKFYHFLKYVEDDMLRGFDTKEKIKEDWIKSWEKIEGEAKGISGFAVGAERIVYALFNGKAFGQPNSAPVGSDLFFETEDAFIHVDLKTVQTRNIGDYTTSIFVGDNQNSYEGKIQVQGSNDRDYKGALPPIYKNSGNPKVCLSYFITILYDEEDLSILNINILCLPNGLLNSVYGSDVLKAGKNPGKIRFNFMKTDTFRLIDNQPKRIKVVYFNENMKKHDFKKLKYIHELYKSQ
ncbi:MAG: hypothetical protein Q8Q01_05040 [archaeon]|nr:hypothetical protein [archaeon]